MFIFALGPSGEPICVCRQVQRAVDRPDPHPSRARRGHNDGLMGKGEHMRNVGHGIAARGEGGGAWGWRVRGERPGVPHGADSVCMPASC